MLVTLGKGGVCEERRELSEPETMANMHTAMVFLSADSVMLGRTVSGYLLILTVSVVILTVLLQNVFSPAFER